MASINLIGYDNGIGLSRDMRLLADALHRGGHAVTVSALAGDRHGRRTGARGIFERCGEAWHQSRSRIPQYDINIMIERVRPLYMARARVNLLLGNPDWFKPSDSEHYGLLDGILVKTHHAEPIFSALGKRVVHVGFTSEDRLLREVPRQRTFLHLAGRSEVKGTARLLALWQRHPQWPRLTVLQHPKKVRNRVAAPNIEHCASVLDDTALKGLQNAHAFHLCPSETEGFGHYIVEAMSVGALTVTVDAPPMSELVAPDRGLLVPCRETGTQNLARTYRFDEMAMENAIASIMEMDDCVVRAIGARAREWFEANDRAFRLRIAQAVCEWV